MSSKRSDFLFKTELCMNFVSKIPCPHWPNCKFAHGNSEIRSITLEDIESEMGVDINFYRTRPCFDYVSTGSCPFGDRCKAIHDPRAKGATESWLRHTKFPLCSKDLILDSVSYIDHLHTITSETIHEGNSFGMTLTKDPIEDQFEAFYNRVTNYCGGMDILAMKIASVFLQDPPEKLLKYNPTHSYLGQACSVESKVFLVHFSVDSGTFSVHEIPTMLSNTLMPNIIIAHLIKVGQPSKSNPVRVYFGSIPHLELSSKDAIKAAIRKQSFDSKELNIHLPYLEFLIPYDDDALDLVRDILMHKISASEGTYDAFTSWSKSKELLSRFTSLVRFFQGQWFPKNKTQERSWNAAVPSVRSAYNVCEIDNSDTANLWNSFIVNMLSRSTPETENVKSVAMKKDELPRLINLMNREHIAGKVPHIKWNEDGNELESESVNPCKLTWKDIMINPSEGWNSLSVFYSQNGGA